MHPNLSKSAYIVAYNAGDRKNMLNVERKIILASKESAIKILRSINIVQKNITPLEAIAMHVYTSLNQTNRLFNTDGILQDIMFLKWR